MELLHKFLWIFHPEGIRWLISTGGMPVICAIIFAETGIFALLPGDSLLVLCGLLAVPDSQGHSLLPLWGLLTLLPICAILGDQVGFNVGSWFGGRIRTWPDKSILGLPVYKQAWLAKTEAFYKRWGSFFLIAGRFIPIVRTLSPIVAGMTRMPYKVFLSFDVVGSLAWVWSMVMTGYLLGDWVSKTFGVDLAAHIDKVAVVVIALSLMPVVWVAFKERRAARSGTSAS